MARVNAVLRTSAVAEGVNVVPHTVAQARETIVAVMASVVRHTNVVVVAANADHHIAVVEKELMERASAVLLMNAVVVAASAVLHIAVVEKEPMEKASVVRHTNVVVEAVNVVLHIVAVADELIFTSNTTSPSQYCED